MAATALDVILLGGGGRARAWLEVISRASRLSCVAHVPDARGGAWLDALAAHPSASVAAALPPRAGLEVGRELARRGRAGLLEGPIHGDGPAPASGAERVRVAHGWVTLWGAHEAARAVAALGEARLNLVCRGLPEEPGGGLEEQLPHALALVMKLLPGAAPSALRSEGDVRLWCAFAAGAKTLELALEPGEPRVTLECGAFSWAASGATETLTLERGKRLDRPLVPAAERALRQLVDGSGDDLVAAMAAARLAARLWKGRAPVAPRRFVQAARKQGLDALGLRGDVPPGAPEAAREEAPPGGARTELWAFRAGHKPVVFLTMRPEEERAVLAPFGDVHVERLARRVRVEGHDTWVDRRGEGEPAVELYLSKDEGLARRAAALQAGADPTRSMRELGELLGYPACCVDAFAAQGDRANNTANRYATFTRTDSPGPWPWELNNFAHMLLAFFPCRYDCPRAVAVARAALAELERAHPGAGAALKRQLTGTVLYFSHGAHLSAGEGGLRVAREASADFARFAGALGATLAPLEWTDDALAAGPLRFERTDPGLGLKAEFI